MALTKYVPEATNINKGYATEENAIKAAQKKFSNSDLRFLVMQGDNGRWFPVFIGPQAIAHGVHFHFHVVG